MQPTTYDLECLIKLFNLFNLIPRDVSESVHTDYVIGLIILNKIGQIINNDTVHLVTFSIYNYTFICHYLIASLKAENKC